MLRTLSRIPWSPSIGVREKMSRHIRPSAHSPCQASATMRGRTAAMFRVCTSKACCSVTSVLPSEEQSLKLRAIFVNDVYELDNWPRFLTAVNALSEGTTIVCLAGDFVAPSLLSTLDHGKGMVDCMNRCKVQFVCFGNHETDIPHHELIDRAKESQFTWINSNMRDLDLGDISLPEYEIVEVCGGGQRRRVALLGLLSDDPGLYRPRSFNNATILPVIDEAERLRKELYDEKKVDLVIPLTHQSIEEDVQFARHFQHKGPNGDNENAFPVVFAAHDHDPMHEEVGGCIITKTGMDLNNVGVCDVIWRDAESRKTQVSAWLVPITDFEPDEEMQRVVDRHKEVLKELDSAPLFLCEGEWLGGKPMTSRDNRIQQTNLCTKLVSSIRDALGSECCMLNAGNIRGDKDYPQDKTLFTYNDLKTEILFDCEMVTVPLPGRVIAAAVRYSRARSHAHPPEPHPMFLQLCDNMTYDDATQTLTHVGGEPLDLDREYSCGLLFMLLTGLDEIPSLVEWARGNPWMLPRDTCAQLGRPAKLLLVDYYSKALYYQLGSFASIDQDGKGYISREDIFAGVQRQFGTAAAHICVDNIMRAADRDGSGRVSREEVLRVLFANAWARRDMDANRDGFLQREEVEAFATRVFGPHQDVLPLVDRIFAELACSNAPQLSRAAVELWMADTFDMHAVSVPGQSRDRAEIEAVRAKLSEREGGAAPLRERGRVIDVEPGHGRRRMRAGQDASACPLCGSVRRGGKA